LSSNVSSIPVVFPQGTVTLDMKVLFPHVCFSSPPLSCLWAHSLSRPFLVRFFDFLLILHQAGAFAFYFPPPLLPPPFFICCMTCPVWARARKLHSPSNFSFFSVLSRSPRHPSLLQIHSFISLFATSPPFVSHPVFFFPGCTNPPLSTVPLNPFTPN